MLRRWPWIIMFESYGSINSNPSYLGVNAFPKKLLPRGDRSKALEVISLHTKALKCT